MQLAAAGGHHLFAPEATHGTGPVVLVMDLMTSFFGDRRRDRSDVPLAERQPWAGLRHERDETGELRLMAAVNVAVAVPRRVGGDGHGRPVYPDEAGTAPCASLQHPVEGRSN
jgi:hypothetical protein